MSISKEAVQYILLTNNTKESSIVIPNLKAIQQQPPWRHSKPVFVEIGDSIIEAQYVFDGHPTCIRSGYESCIQFQEGILPQDCYRANITIDEKGQKYLRTPEIFFKIWETDPTFIPPESLGDPVDAGWSGGCTIA